MPVVGINCAPSILWCARTLFVCTNAIVIIHLDIVGVEYEIAVASVAFHVLVPGDFTFRFHTKFVPIPDVVLHSSFVLRFT
jgi:hypothetical protein